MKTNSVAFRIKILSLVILAAVLVCAFVYVSYTNNNVEDADSSSIDSLQAEVYSYKGFTDARGSMILGDYGRVEVILGFPENINDKDVEDFINRTLMEYPVYSISSKDTVGVGDSVDISFTSSLEGNSTIEDAEDGFVLTVGSASMIDGFEDSLLGRKPGESYIVTLVYPENEGKEEYRGKRLVFDITVNAILDKTVYDYVTVTDGFLNDSLGIYSKEALFTETKSQMFSIIRQAREDALSNIFPYYLASCDYDLPDELVKERMEQSKIQFVNQYCDGDADKYADMVYELSGLSLNDFEQQMWDMVYTETAIGIASEMIAEKEKLLPDDSELQSYIEDVAAYAGYNQEDGDRTLDGFLLLFDTLYESARDYFRRELIKDKIEALLYENAVVIYDNGMTVTSAVFREP